jgi:hypothetical protein
MEAGIRFRNANVPPPNSSKEMEMVHPAGKKCLP